ncbi:unnamed protein product [Dimorphilus gyrociliatus]|uniref:Uncharacterized protein n=1 Tax=Dimorphilus gyrociliatus TaxID=2664684 RepID=A0A7I8VE19_9ANNE|nr:unnamed protein product [Dimorphilus gyrociliatus]
MNGTVLAENIGESPEIVRKEEAKVEVKEEENVDDSSADSEEDSDEDGGEDQAIRQAKLEKTKKVLGSRRVMHIKYGEFTLTVLKDIDRRLGIVQEALMTEINYILETDRINCRNRQGFYKILYGAQHQIDELRLQVQQLSQICKEKQNHRSTTNLESSDEEEASSFLFSETIVRAFTESDDGYTANISLGDIDKAKAMDSTRKRNVNENMTDLPRKKSKNDEKQTTHDKQEKSENKDTSIDENTANAKNYFSKGFNLLGIKHLEHLRNILERTLIDQTEEEFQRNLSEVCVHNAEIRQNALISQRIERLRNITHLMTHLMDLMEYIVQSAITILTIPSEE